VVGETDDGRVAIGGLDCEVDVVESVDTAVEAEGAVESAEVVVGAEVSVGASVAVDVEEVSEDVVGAEVVGTDELSDGTSDADVPDVSEEGAVSETGAEAFPNESSPALATPSLISAIYEHLDLPDPRQLRPCRNARAWQMVVRR
jgi:hypothetical protein